MEVSVHTADPPICCRSGRLTRELYLFSRPGQFARATLFDSEVDRPLLQFFDKGGASFSQNALSADGNSFRDCECGRCGNEQDGCSLIEESYQAARFATCAVGQPIVHKDQREVVV